MTIRISWKRAMVALLVIGGAGLLFAWSGAMQISASSGHWRITDWFLHWTMRNSVRTYAWASEPDSVRDDSGLVSAAGHFRQACAVCHGAPGVRPSPVMQHATPPAPDLAVNAAKWRDRELFWILQHGVKFTGMLAWPTDTRPDEVRRMVAFVRRLPTMTPAQYRALTQEEDTRPLPGIRPAVLAVCTGCHGTDGRGRGQGDIPVIAGQKASYLREALGRYATGERKSGIMQTAAATLTGGEIDALARHFAAMPGLEDSALTDPMLTRSDPARQLPACTGCHAPGKAAPIIAGQKARYVADRLHAWQGEETEIDARKPHATMPVIARRIGRDRIDAVAAAVAGKDAH